MPDENSAADERQKQMIEMLAKMRHLPIEQQNEAVLDLLTCALEYLPVSTILELRSELVRRFPPHAQGCGCPTCGAKRRPAIETLTEIIDGHLALRELNGQ